MTHPRPPRRPSAPTGPLSAEDLNALGQFVSRDGVWYFEPPKGAPPEPRRPDTRPLS